MLHMNTPHTPKAIRVTVPVSPEVLELFQRFSKLSGQSVGRSMGSWLEETKDGIAPMMDILEHHKKAPMKAIQTLQNYAGTLTDLSEDLFSKVAVMDRGEVEMAAAVEASKNAIKVMDEAKKSAASGRGPARGDGGRTRASGVLTPPSSNTGGKGRKTTKKATGGSK